MSPYRVSSPPEEVSSEAERPWFPKIHEYVRIGVSKLFQRYQDRIGMVTFITESGIYLVRFPQDGEVFTHLLYGGPTLHCGGSYGLYTIDELIELTPHISVYRKVI